MTSFMGDPRFAQEMQLKRVAENMEASANEPQEASEDHEAHVAGQRCAHCERAMTADVEVRKTANGEWVHANCPT
jgi:hypothetical protein